MNNQLATDVLAEVRWAFVGGWAREHSGHHDDTMRDCADPGSGSTYSNAQSPQYRWRQGSVISMPMWELVGRLRINPPGSRRLAMHYVHYLDPALAFVVSEMP